MAHRLVVGDERRYRVEDRTLEADRSPEGSFKILAIIEDPEKRSRITGVPSSVFVSGSSSRTVAHFWT